MWYHGHNMTCEPSYLMGRNHGIILETEYTSREHRVIVQLEKVCNENCVSSWSIGYFPDEYKGITFRFFADCDLVMFREALQELEGNQ
jgi:hypothetical protein